MDINRIRGLTEQHQALRSFLGSCKDSNVELIARATPYTYADTILNSSTTRTIVGEIRSIISQRIIVVEAEIKDEVARG